MQTPTHSVVLQGRHGPHHGLPYTSKREAQATKTSFLHHFHTIHKEKWEDGTCMSLYGVCDLCLVDIDLCMGMGGVTVHGLIESVSTLCLALWNCQNKTELCKSISFHALLKITKVPNFSNREHYMGLSQVQCRERKSTVESRFFHSIRHIVDCGPFSAFLIEVLGERYTNTDH